MALFTYTGRDHTGELIEGQREADSTDAIASHLAATRITPISINEIKQKGGVANTLARSLGLGKPGLADLILFSRQMYALVKSGVPIIRGLTLVADSTRNPIFADSLKSVVDDLESGRTFSGALARHPEIFKPLYINIVRVGEETGKLEEALLRLYQYFDQDKITLEKIKSALFYPITVIVAIILAVMFLMAKVIPKFAEIFEKFELDLPIQTKVIISISNFIAEFWWLLAMITAVTIVGVRHYVKTEQGRYNWHSYKMRLPAIGDIIRRATLARFSRSFAMSNSAGVPLLQGLTITSKAVDNDYVEVKIRAMRTEVEKGETITRAATSTGLFTPLVLQMLAVGEETGQIDQMMEEVADFYEREVAYDVDNITKIIEPVLTVILGIMVLILAMGIFLPMWDLVKITQG